MKTVALLFLALLFAESSIAASAIPVSSGERRVDEALSPSLQPVEGEPGLPRVLLIGDSISMGYTLRVRALLKGRANVHRPPTNCGPTVKGLAEIDRWLGGGRWSVIHFNFGLHDLKFLKGGEQAVPVDKYEANLRVLVERMRKTDAKIVWATTTPAPAKARAGQFRRLPEDVLRYNAAAARVAADFGLHTDDLYAAVLPRISELQNPNDVHFNSRGCDALAAQVVRSISEVLSKQ